MTSNLSLVPAKKWTGAMRIVCFLEVLVFFDLTGIRTIIQMPKILVNTFCI